MIYLIKFIFFLLVTNISFASENKTNQILFKINEKVFTNIDLEQRKEYVALINNLTVSEFSKIENKEIFDDYISALIFYEYFIQNKKYFKNKKPLFLHKNWIKGLEAKIERFKKHGLCYV